MRYSALRRLFLILFFAVGVLHAAPEKTVRIGIVVDSDDYALQRVSDWFQLELTALLQGEFDVQFLEKDRYSGNWDGEKIENGIDTLLTDPEVDIIVGMGSISSHKLAKRKDLSKPSFAPFIMQHEKKGLPDVNGQSGVHNLNYLMFPTNIKKNLIDFQRVAPFKTVTIIAHQAVVEQVNVLQEMIQQLRDELNLKIHFLPVGDSVEQALAQIPKDTEVAYIMPLTQFDQEELEQLADGLLKRKIPAFSIFSERYLDAGFLASMSPDSDFPRMVRRTALNIQRALLGEDPGSLSTKVSEVEQLTINMKTVRDLKISPSWDILDQATFVNFDYSPEGLQLDLLGAVTLALQSNLSLQAALKGVSAGAEDINLSRANLLPQVEVGGYWRRIDRDRAERSLGTQRGEEACSVARMKQVLYSNELFGDYTIQKYLQRAREWGYESDSLDLVFRVTEVYFNLLRANTLLGIHIRNLERTKSHLKLARQRVKVGVANSSEVYRWESQHATDMTNVLQARYQVRAAAARLKRILSISQEEDVSIKEVSLDAEFWAKKKEWLLDHVYSDQTLEWLINYSVKEGLSLSSEIKEMQFSICAQAEAVGVARRAYWTPDIFLSYEVDDCFAEWGARAPLKPPFNSTDWRVGVQVSYPLYTGGAISSRKRQACKELQKLQLELDSLIEAKMERIRVALYQAANSYSAIGLSEESASSAHENLDLVQDGYSKGVMSIVDLIDAQNQALIADMETVNAIYDFLIDLMKVQRNIGRFDFLMSKNEMDQWVQNISTYFNIKEGK